MGLFTRPPGEQHGIIYNLELYSYEYIIACVKFYK